MGKLLFEKNDTIENLQVYGCARELQRLINHHLARGGVPDLWIKDQLRRAVVSVMINLAEGSGRSSKGAKKNFFVIARASLYECVSLLDVLLDMHTLTVQEYATLYKKCEQISKMLYRLIRSF